MTGAVKPGHDLRLLVPAMAAWLAALAGPWLGVGGTAVAALASLGAVVALRRRPAAVAAVLVVGAVLGGVAVRLEARDRGPLDDLAARSRTVRVVATVAEDPRRSLTRTWGAVPVEQVVVRLRVSEVLVDGASTRVRQSVLAVGQGDGWAGVTFGDRVAASLSLHPAGRADQVAAVGWVRGPPTLLAGPPPLLAGAEAMRSGLRRAVQPLAPDPRGLLPALVVGDTTGLPADLVTDLRASGLAHLTAVSGANVAIICVAVLLAARLVGVRGVALPAVGVLATAGFVVLARPQPSVLRAALMGSVAVLAIAVSGRRPGIPALLATVVGLLLVDPWLARSWGFALSVAATAGLLVLAPRWRERWSRRLPPALAEAAAVALAAQVATLPLSVALSGQVSLVGLPANVLAAPAVAPATVLGALAAVLSPVAPPVAHAIAWLGGIPAGWICLVARRAAAWPMAVAPWPHGWRGAAAVLLALALVGGAARTLVRRGRRTRWAAALVAAVVVAAALHGPLRWPPPGWVLVACDVGQGDGLVLNAGGGTAVVVDVGPDPTLFDRCLSRLGVRQIGLLVLTHDHADHVMGLPGALDGRPVAGLLVSPLAEPEEQAAAVSGWVGDAGAPVATAVPGMSGQVGDIRWLVLAPLRIIRGEGSDPNNNSVVLLVEVHGLRILLTGDVEPAAQEALLESGADLHADVLKVPHHGSANQDPAFLSSVGAGLALISVGVDNPYGHPDPGLVASLQSAGVVVGRTDQDGDLAVVTGADGVRLVTRR